MEKNKAIQMHKEIEPYSIQINKHITGYIEKLDNPRKLINNIYDILKKYDCNDKELIECIKKILQKIHKLGAGNRKKRRQPSFEWLSRNIQL
mgnify:CR=1 FL=1